MRIVAVIASLGGGGAERVMSWLTGALAERGCEVTLVTLSSAATDFYTLAPAVRRTALDGQGASANALEALWANARRLRRLRRAILAARPDVVISFTDRTNVLCLASLAGSGIPVIVSERIDPTQYPLGAIWEWGRRISYPRAAAVVVQTASARAWAAEWLRVPVYVIPNATTVGRDQVAAGSNGSGDHGSTIVAMGRLQPQKGFDLLLRAFARLSPRFPDWRLCIYGEGTERAALEELRNLCGLRGVVALPGQTPEAARVMADSALFVLPSRFEGFPNVLLEAMALGRPVVAFDCPSGPRELVDHGVNGLLVPAEDEMALAEALARMMANPAERARLGAAAHASVARFAPQVIADQWYALCRDMGVSRGD